MHLNIKIHPRILWVMNKEISSNMLFYLKSRNYGIVITQEKSYIFRYLNSSPQFVGFSQGDTFDTPLDKLRLISTNNTIEKPYSLMLRKWYQWQIFYLTLSG